MYIEVMCAVLVLYVLKFGVRNIGYSTHISVFNQLDAQNLFHSKFYFMLLHVSSTYAHQQEVKYPIGVMIPEAV